MNIKQFLNIRQCIIIFPILFALFVSNHAISAIPLAKNGDVPTLAPILKKTNAAVVNISTKGSIEMENNPFFDNPFFNDPFFRKFFGFEQPRSPMKRETQSIGSGVIVNANEGYVITNHHVIDNAKEIIITLLDKRRFEAKLIGSDEETDIAILQIKDGQDLTAVNMGSSSELEVGDFVVAIGNPFGLGHTVTSGIVSALGRSGLGIEGYEDFIQTDASINLGNSGGALIDLHGDLVGINTAILSRTGGNVGIGFAIPVDMVKSVMHQLIKHGEVSRGRLGVNIQDMIPEIAKAMKLDVEYGALVASVDEDSPAQKAGIKAGDVIIAVNNHRIESSAELKNRIGMLRVGAKAKLKIIRANKTITVEVKTQKRDFEKDDKGEYSADIELLKGATFGLPSEHPLHDGKTEGVLVLTVKPGSAAERAGLRMGDIVLSVNQVRVKTPKQLFEAARLKEKGILMHIKRDKSALFIVIN